MKKFFSLIAAVLFAGSMMAEGILFEQTYPGNPSTKTNSYSKSFTLTTGDYTLTYANVNNGAASNAWDAVRAGSKNGASTATITTEAIAESVSKVVINFTQVNASKTNALSLKVASDATFADATVVNATIAIGEVAFVIADPSENKFYQVVIDMAQGSENGFNRWDKIQFISPDGDTPIIPVEYDTLTVADARLIADTLADKAMSKEKYYVEGYAVHVADYSADHKNQDFFMVDDAAAPDSLFQAYRATPTKDGKPYPVLAGDKVRVFGNLKKFGTQLEIVNGIVSFIEEVEGDRTIVEPTPDTITVAQALEIGGKLASGKSTTEMYVLEGYVTGLSDNKGNPSADGGYAQYGNQTMWLADSLDEAAISKDKAFMVYQAVASDSTQITKGAKLSFKCAIKNYNGTIENSVYPITVTILEKGEEPVKPAAPDTISVDSALVIGSALASKEVTKDTYCIPGYISKIVDNSFNTDYKNMTFWITAKPGSDAATNAEGAFEVYRGKPDRELAVGNKVLVTTQIQKWSDGVIESTQNCSVLFLEEGEVPEYDTLTVAMAKDMADALPVNVLSEKKYYVIGYAANVSEYDSRYPYQDFYMVADATAPNTELKAFHAVPTKGSVAAPVLAGDKVCLFGALQKFVADSSSAPQLQVVNPKAEILEAVEGDRTIPEPKWDKITAAQAIEIGRGLNDGGVTELKYEITGYVSYIASLYNTSTKKENFWIHDSKESQASSNADGAFYVYGGKPKNEQELGLGAKVTIVTTIKKYVSKGVATIENDKEVSVEVLEQGELVVDTLSVEEAKEEALKLEKNQTGAKFYAVKGFIHKVKEAYSTQYKNASFYISDDVNETETDVYCYHTSLNAADTSKVAVGSYVIVTGHLMHNFYNDKSSAQIPTGSAIFTEAPAPVELEPIAIAEAIEIANALAPAEGETATTKEKYAVKGYAIEVDNDDYTYALSDNSEAEYGEFKANYCSSIDAEVNEGDVVIVTGKISIKNNGSYNSYYVEEGVLTHQSAEGIRQVVLTEKVQKMMIDGAIYIIRNGKMYDLRGAQVR